MYDIFVHIIVTGPTPSIQKPIRTTFSSSNTETSNQNSDPRINQSLHFASSAACLPLVHQWQTSNQTERFVPLQSSYNDQWQGSTSNQTGSLLFASSLQSSNKEQNSASNPSISLPIWTPSPTITPFPPTSSLPDLLTQKVFQNLSNNNSSASPQRIININNNSSTSPQRSFNINNNNTSNNKSNSNQRSFNEEIFMLEQQPNKTQRRAYQYETRYVHTSS